MQADKVFESKGLVRTYKSGGSVLKYSCKHRLWNVHGNWDDGIWEHKDFITADYMNICIYCCLDVEFSWFNCGDHRYDLSAVTIEVGVFEYLMGVMEIAGNEASMIPEKPKHWE